MADRCIIFSAPMVRALLDERKTQTRRLAFGGMDPHEIEPPYFVRPWNRWCWADEDGRVHSVTNFQSGDRAYVREAWRVHRSFDAMSGSELEALAPRVWPEVDRDNCDAHGRYRHARFMPRWASRLTLFVENVRVQRLQDISEDDAIAEGIIEYEPTEEDPAEFSYVDGGDIWNNARSAYAALWDSLHSKAGTRWGDNPWIYALMFRVVRGNIDHIGHGA